MKKLFFVFLTFLISSYTSFSQSLKSPDDFLGYQLGSKYTPHYKIVNYFQQAANAMPKMIRLEQYGQTNEGRTLLLAFIASEENFVKLEGGMFGMNRAVTGFVMSAGRDSMSACSLLRRTSFRTRIWDLRRARSSSRS